MTNVKIKLMFFLLNTLLTADIVQARPYSDKNTTDVVIKFTNNDTITFPIESDSDTLIVADDDDDDDDDETPEETNKSSNTQMEAIMNAEQDRDIALSKKTMKEIAYEIPQTDAAALEQQRNISSPLLEEIIDSETDREETLTDILFRPEAQFEEEMPRFEFLIAAKINGSETNKSVNTKRISDNDLSKVDINNSNVLRKIDYVELVEMDKAKHGENKSSYSMGNITGHEVDNDAAPDTRFTDLQTLFFACVGTLVPLLGVLFATLLIRCMCRRWCPMCCKKPTDSSVSDSSDKQDLNHQQLKSPTDEEGEGDAESSEVPTANGSIITMTLKNNHLIVETEERNDIAKNGRETKMKYSPDNDGIFVVEVQQSAVYRPNNKSLQNSPPHDPQISTNQAQIHRVPEEMEIKTIDEESERSSGKFEKALALSSTGLSISDLSLSSIGSHNVSYSYGSQIGYEQGPFGYPVYAGYDIPKEDTGNSIIHDNSREPLLSKTPTDPDRPVVTAAIFKQDSIIGNDALQGPGYCIEGSTDGPLLSDVQAREVSLQHIHDQMEKKLENGVAVPISEKIESPKNSFNRADSLPVRLEDEKPLEPVVNKSTAMEVIKEDDMPSVDVLKMKRASLPIIRTEMYESVKDVILSSSPKFERFKNEASPSENFLENPPPLITISEESESGKPEKTS